MGSMSIDQALRVDLPLLHALMGHYARQYEDVQKARVAFDLRVGSLTRDGFPAEWAKVAATGSAEMLAAEHAIGLALQRYARLHPMRTWVDAQRGLGLQTFGALLGSTGDLHKFLSVAKLWRFLGLHVVDGGAARRRRGTESKWSHRGKALCYLIGEAIVKNGKGGIWRDMYDRKKAEYEAGRPDWTQMRRHNAAKRYAVKKLLAAMWREWRRIVPEAESVG